MSRTLNDPYVRHREREFPMKVVFEKKNTKIESWTISKKSLKKIALKMVEIIAQKHEAARKSFIEWHKINL